MPVKKPIYTAIILAMFIVSCKKKHGSSDVPVPDKPFVTDIYAVGFKIIEGATYGIYWKNGQQENITSEFNSAIYSAVTVGTDVYLAGKTSVGATYWKNGNLVYLAQGFRSSAYTISVSGNDIYVGGAIYKPGDKYERAVYWKNGVEYDLTDGSTESYVSSIAVNGNDVYTVGQYNLPDNGNTAGTPVATYWKNQTVMTLEGALVPSYGSFAKGIAINGSDVYVTGYIGFGAALWKNGTLQPLDDSSGSPLDAYSFTVGINGSDIYLGGEHGNEASYWKNGTIKDLISGPFVASGVQCICFQGSDVYMGGYLGNAPVYWKNDTAHSLQNNGEAYSVTGIAVSRHQ